jgi:hypothetical protein
MNPPRPSLPSPLRPRGSALITVLLFTFIISLLVGSILTWSITERRLNTRTVHWIESRNAAESLCEYGAAQVSYAISNLTLPDPIEIPFFDPLQAVGPNYNPPQLPVIPGSATSPFNPNSANGITTESHVDTNPLSSADLNGLEVIAGPRVQITTPGQKLYTIDPAIPENANDPYVGLRVQRYDYNIMAKATVVTNDGLPPITTYVQQKVSVRGAPLFDWAIFYATSDLEVYPGKPMVVTGPVHTNSDMYLSPTDAGSISFQGPVTTTGHIFRAMENSTDHQTAINYTNDVNFKGPAGQVSMHAAGGWRDSTYGTDTGIYGPDTPGSTLYNLANNLANKTNFTTYAAQTWPSTVLTADMGVPPFNPKGFNQPLAAGTDPKGNLYKADTPYVDNGTQIPVAGGAITIDKHIMDYAGTLTNGNVSYFNDPPDSSFPTMLTSNAYYVARKGLEDVKYSVLANLYILVNVDYTNNWAIVTYYGPYNFNKIGTGAVGTNGPPGPNGGVLLGQNKYTFAGVASGGPLVTSGETGAEPYGLVSFIPYVIAGGNVTSGLYDQRQSAPVDLVVINVNALNRALMDVNMDTTAGGGPKHTFPGETGATTYLDAIMNYQDPNPNGVANATHAFANATIWGSGNVGNIAPNTILNDNTAGLRDGAVTPGGWNGTIYIDVESTPILDPNIAGTHEIGVAIGNGQTKLNAAGTKITFNTALPDQDPLTINLVPNHLNADGTPTANTGPFGSVPDAIVGPQLGLNYNAGLTIATNAPVYVVGNFNADGAHFGAGPLPAADAAVQSDDLVACPAPDECPVAIIGDAVTFLSPQYFGPIPAAGTKFGTSPSCADPFPHFAPDGTLPPNPINTPGNNAYNSKSTSNPNSTGNTEVAMAMVSGLVLTNASAASGGVHNLPRYLENWGGVTHVIRGSLVNLYSSKIAIDPYGTGYYSPPDRVWGFAQLFSDCGILPPSTPFTFSNRRTYFNDLSKTQYNALRTDAIWGWPGHSFPALP